MSCARDSSSMLSSCVVCGGAVTLVRSEHLSVLFLLHVYELFLAVIELVLQECELL